MSATGEDLEGGSSKRRQSEDHEGAPTKRMQSSGIVNTVSEEIGDLTPEEAEEEALRKRIAELRVELAEKEESAKKTHQERIEAERRLQATNEEWAKVQKEVDTMGKRHFHQDMVDGMKALEEKSMKKYGVPVSQHAITYQLHTQYNMVATAIDNRRARDRDGGDDSATIKTMNALEFRKKQASDYFIKKFEQEFPCLDDNKEEAEDHRHDGEANLKGSNGRKGEIRADLGDFRVGEP